MDPGDLDRRLSRETFVGANPSQDAAHDIIGVLAREMPWMGSRTDA
jgi:hypothetical protein